MTSPEERETACAAFLQPSVMSYAVPVEHEGESRWMLCDDDGDPLVISSLDMIRAIALEAGLVLCSRH
jgi:hypothetical protein